MPSSPKEEVLTLYQEQGAMVTLKTLCAVASVAAILFPAEGIRYIGYRLMGKQYRGPVGRMIDEAQP